MEHFPTANFMYTVIWLYPIKFKEEKIFQDNLSHTLSDLKELIKERELLEGNKSILSCLHFDSQIEKQKRYIAENEQKILKIKNRMNEGISPYRWMIFENVDECENGIYIKADYVLKLV